MAGLRRIRRSAGVVAAICCLTCLAIAADVAPAHQRKALKNPAPVYPQLAREQGLRGTVRIEVTITPSGAVKSTRALGGHPVLIQAAEQALKNWKFEPGGESTVILEFRFTGE